MISRWIGKLGMIATLVVMLGGVAGWAQDQTTSGNQIDLWSAVFVLGILVIALGGLIVYEAVSRRRT